MHRRNTSVSGGLQNCKVVVVSDKRKLVGSREGEDIDFSILQGDYGGGGIEGRFNNKLFVVGSLPVVVFIRRQADRAIRVNTIDPIGAGPNGRFHKDIRIIGIGGNDKSS